MKSNKLVMKFFSCILVCSLSLTVFQPLSVFSEQSTQVAESKPEKMISREDEMRLLNAKGDLTLEQLQTAELSPEDIPEVVSLESIKEKGHVNRLFEQERDLNSIIFQNRDGTKTMYYYPNAVKYVDSEGVVRDKSNILTEDISNKRFKADYAYVNSANDIQTYFPKTLNKNTGIILEGYDVQIDFVPISFGTSGGVEKGTLLSAKSTSAQKGNIRTEQKNNQDAVLYYDAFGDNTTIRFTPTFEGFKEDIILDSYAGINEFTYRVQTNGLTLLSENGVCYFIDSLTGEIRAKIDEIKVFDNKNNEETTIDVLKGIEETKLVESSTSSFDENLELSQFEEEKKSTKSYNHYYRVEIIKPDEEYLITLVVDKSYLTAEETVYPVTIDPSTTIIPLGIWTKTIVDAPIYSGRPTNQHGFNEESVIGYAPSYSGEYFGVGRELMQFPGLMDNPTFESLSDSSINNVNVYMRATGGGSSPSRIQAYIFNGNDWTEGTVTCESADWDSYATFLSSSYVSGAAWTFFDITEAAKAWKTGAYSYYKGILIKNELELSSSFNRKFATTEYNSSSAFKPYVTVNYSCDITVSTEITDGGAYYIKNYNSGKYMENDKTGDVIQNNKTTNISDIPYQRWQLRNWGQSLYWLQPMNDYSDIFYDYKYVLSVNSWGGLEISRKNGDVNINQLFVLECNDDGTYYIHPAITGNDSSLTVSGTNVGEMITTNTHSFSDPSMKWLLEEENTFTATVNNYYDNGYRVRYNGAIYDTPNVIIRSHQNWVNSKYSNIFDLNITADWPNLIVSTADMCKYMSGLDITKITIEQLCEDHKCQESDGTMRSCTNESIMYNDFISRFPGSDLSVNVLWSGHKLDTNRSFYSSDHGIMIDDLPSDIAREEKERFTLLHELAHNFGAPDHYCETFEDTYTEGGRKCEVERCYYHHPNQGYTKDCVMGQYIEGISSYNDEDIFCDKCYESIQQHLLQHH